MHGRNLLRRRTRPVKVEKLGAPFGGLQNRVAQLCSFSFSGNSFLAGGLALARGASDVRETVNVARDHHHMGACRKSRDPDSGWVVENCRVHSTWNLYVEGSSACPPGGARHTTLTIAVLVTRVEEYVTSR